jgi:hypothetical protein
LQLEVVGAERTVDAAMPPQTRYAGSAVDFQPAGRHALKGVPDEWDVYSVG